MAKISRRRGLAATLVASSAWALSTVNRMCFENNDLFTESSAVRAFTRARAELGMGPGNLPTKWSSFFTTSYPDCVVVQAAAHCFAYHTIFKCGNNAIRESLLPAIKERGVEVQRTDGLPCRRLHQEAKMRCRSKPVTSFTFVREPLSHFVSGYGEYMFREYTRKQGRMHRSGLYDQIRALVKPRDEPSRFLFEFVTGVEEAFQFEHYVNEKHMSLMSTRPEISGRAPVDFVGRLPRADEDWTELFAKTDGAGSELEALQLRPELGPHESSLDRLGVRAEMYEILRTNHTLRRALCYLIERDYVCYDYDFAACLNGTALLQHS